jgi:hypothetical protein
MKGQIRNGLKATAVLLVAATLGWSQTSMSAPVPNESASNVAVSGQSAMRHQQGVPGTINYVEGQASLNGQPLDSNTAGMTAQPNEPIETQAGYVEVLLTPGAFLRIGHDSEVVMQTLGLANIQLQVLRGSAMIEATDLVEGATLQVSMDGATTQIEKHGLYSFDANQHAVKVLDGKAKVLQAGQVKSIGKDHEILLADNPNLKSQDFDKKTAQHNPLYVWSSARSAAEAQANVNLASSVVVNGGSYGPGWYWDPFWADYAFLPGAGFLYSPFGYGFYSPGFVWAAPYYGGFYGRNFYGRGYYGHGRNGHVGGFAAAHSAAPHAAFSGGGFHGGGFGGGGFHGGGGGHR